KALGCRVVPVQANQRKGLEALAEAMQAAVDEAKPAKGPGLPTLLPGAAEPDTIRRRYAWARQMLVDAVTRTTPNGPRFSDRVDKILTHKVWGLLAMILVMGAIFQSIFAWSQPIMDGIDTAVHWFGAWALKPVPAGLLKELL